ncbi:DEAD/DEAH box helicase [Mesobacterium sp. TK19101]|uniref:DEAD/DEAH box helicase n=1 Tax=Mesobacterium hydrothermale TaxID=3111907 RepID=A0ABU6HF31_9RHOB|nr:DEAD/DEAH box helicase [Mesobacterium sp. TK19101]MEC3860455.1 DEAD/DEAH box helicase [Mesobacterium sp. TK19101]
MFQALADALTERGYDTLTAVQEAVTNPELSEQDLLVSAQTGSGKTVGFGLAIAPTMLGDGEVMGQAGAPLALIVAPTRELALQVKRELGWLYAKAEARLATCIGGMDARDERRALERGAHIVVGTPGRLRDHIQRGSLDLGSVRAIVLDEADEMLDLGFREDLEFMLAEAPEDRRTLMFSATVPPMIAKLAEQYQRDAVRVTTLTGGTQHADITYQAVRVAQQDAENAIINLLRFHDAQNAIVFANTRAMVNRLTARLTNRGFSVVALSGELSQNERTHALQAMRDGRARVCVATDVAARGIDLPKLELVIHAELPSNSEGLLHRSGRTGRAGRKGISALIVPPKIAKKAERLLKFAKITAEWITAPSADDILRKDEERLLADDVWTLEPTPEQQDFAARLLELHGPEKIAAAYLALHRARLSAPEDLGDPDVRPERAERAERKAFGPSTWFALSVGRDDRAEPRWLLPVLCRAGKLDKDAIGAIRVQQTESYVEIADASVPGFLSALGANGELDEGVTARKLDAAPEFRSAPRPSGPRPGRPDRFKEDRPRAERPERSERRDDSRARPAPSEDRGEDRGQARSAPKPDRMAEAIADGAVKPHRKPRDRGAMPLSGDDAAPRKKPYGAPRDAASADRKGKPANRPSDKSGASGDKRFGKAGPGAGKSRDGFGDKPKGKFGAKPGDKPKGKFGAKPGDKPKGKFGAKPDARADAKPQAPRAKASDTSKRFTPPGATTTPRKPKPQGKGAAPARGRKGPGGMEPPRRG